MKVKNLIKKMYHAIATGKSKLQGELYRKITRKSLKHKKTHVVQ